MYKWLKTSMRSVWNLTNHLRSLNIRKVTLWEKSRSSHHNTPHWHVTPLLTIFGIRVRYAHIWLYVEQCRPTGHSYRGVCLCVVWATPCVWMYTLCNRALCSTRVRCTFCICIVASRLYRCFCFLGSSRCDLKLCLIINIKVWDTVDFEIHCFVFINDKMWIFHF